jgi:hypothetical protein
LSEDSRVPLDWRRPWSLAPPQLTTTSKTPTQTTERQSHTSCLDTDRGRIEPEGHAAPQHRARDPAFGLLSMCEWLTSRPRTEMRSIRERSFSIPPLRREGVARAQPRDDLIQ